MFARLPDAAGSKVEIELDGATVAVPAPGTIASALLALGHDEFRRTPTRGLGRGPFCMMGVCFDCLVTIDGVANRQACLVPVRAGMRVETGRGARDVRA
ncbi:MAG TPA: (2Fe-2S)-binding protein [Acetobacteraceae bacterium]